METTLLGYRAAGWPALTVEHRQDEPRDGFMGNLIRHYWTVTAGRLIFEITRDADDNVFGTVGLEGSPHRFNLSPARAQNVYNRALAVAGDEVGEVEDGGAPDIIPGEADAEGGDPDAIPPAAVH